MDKISIKNLEVFANHGVYPEETKLGQKFLVSADLRVDIRDSGMSDDMKKFVNYGEVSHFITTFLTKNTYKLIETAAEQLARAILLEYELVQGVTLAIHKPWAPIGLPLEDVAVEITRSRHTVYLSCGSNMGEREAYLNQAVKELNEKEDTQVVKISSFIETEPYGVEDQDRFLNGCIKLTTLLTPRELLNRLHEIEAHAGRERIRRWGPRTLDLDIILYDDIVLADEDLIIPHADMANRLFVLEPLCEIAPYAYHPIYHKRVAELRDELLSR